MGDVIIFFSAISIIISILVIFSIMRLSKLKKRRALGRRISKNNWLDKQLLKRFAKNFPLDD